MCGILYTDDVRIDAKAFSEALNILRHRGPDSTNFVSYDNVKLGHTRLAILDLDERSNQPFYSEDRNLIMIYNGEIYNYRELVKEFQITQKTASDTEALLALYFILREKALDKLNGMYSFVIYNKEERSIFAARDRLGIKPLYYYFRNGAYTFSSEVAPILRLYRDIQFDEYGLRQYRKLRTCFNGRTIYKGISMFPAGRYFINGTFRKYWDVSFERKEPPEEEALYETIQSAIECRTISDVPVGSYLSGGIDSSIVATVANKIDTWTVGFQDENEFKWSDMVSNRIGSNHEKIIIQYNEFISLAQSMIEKRKEPLSVPNEVLLYKMTNTVKEKNRVVLSGEGADELFHGYDRVFRWANENVWDIASFSDLYSYGSAEDYEIVEDALSPFTAYKKAIDKVSAFFQLSHLHGLLRRLDNATMFCSVEARVPFADHRLVEMLAGVPFEYKAEGGIVKAPLKRLFRHLIPKAIIKREKVGFPVPVKRIFHSYPGYKPMDQWFYFNLKALGAEELVRNMEVTL